ncbi:MAG: hypothetical protein K8S99_15070 [Planctomycetes bacterium]|nr:hypothetical protein [Planctomycetota bacterium]
MNFDFIKKKLGRGGGAGPPGNGNGAPVDGDAEGFKRDLRKARKFFEYAHSVTDHDYAIDCFIRGLQHDPDNMKEHEALREISLKRKVSGGKPTTLRERFDSMGKTPVDKMLDAEKMLAKDPLNLSLMIALMEKTAEADEAEPDLKLGEFVYMIGTLVLQLRQSPKPPTKAQLIVARDLFARVEAFEKAVEACRIVLSMEPTNANLLKDMKNLEAEWTMQKAGFDAHGKRENNFRENVADADKQRALDQEDQIAKTSDVADEIIARRRAEYEENPTDRDIMSKLVEALYNRDTEATDDEAIALMNKAWEESQQYRFKVRAGDITLRKLNRRVRALRDELKADASDAELKKQFDEARKEHLDFGFKEFSERVENYPTDLGLRYQLGTRLYDLRRYDEAIGNFQRSKDDPKVRAASHQYLGRCYLHQGWFEEAVDTLRKGIETHADPSDKMALELRYLLMDALEKSAAKNRNLEQAREAQKLSSHILQSNINYLDIKTRADRIRTLLDELTRKTG